MIYVTADVADTIEAPVYAILAMNRRLDSVRIGGAEIARYNSTAPARLDQTALKWDGEWQVTIEVFRTYKGDIEKGVPGTLTVRNPATGIPVWAL